MNRHDDRSKIICWSSSSSSSSLFFISLSIRFKQVCSFYACTCRCLGHSGAVVRLWVVACIVSLAISGFGENTHWKRSGTRSFRNVRPPSGTGCQTHSKMLKTLWLVDGSWFFFLTHSSPLVVWKELYCDWLFKNNYILIGSIIVNSSSMVSQAVLVESDVSIPYFPLKWVKIVWECIP